MKKPVLYLPVFVAGMLLLGFTGCAEEKKEDMTKWPMPKFEKTEEPAMIEYVVVRGDTISAVAEQYGISPLHLAVENDLDLEGRGSIIYPGQTLIIPED